MSIERKWPFARAAVYGDDTLWIAESRAGTGTWVVREDEDDDSWPQDDDGRDYPVYGLKGAFFGFADNHEGVILFMTPEQRQHIGMPDEVYQRLNVDLELSYQDKKNRERERERDRNWTADTDPRATLSRLPPPPPSNPDILEGFELEHQGLVLRRTNQGWVVANTDAVDQLAREAVGIKDS